MNTEVSADDDKDSRVEGIRERHYASVDVVQAWGVKGRGG